MKKQNLKKIAFRIFQVSIITVLAYILIIEGLELKNWSNQKEPMAVLASNNIPFPIAAIRVIEPFTFLNLNAKAVVVYDINNDKIIFSQQKDDILPIASITKLMTIYVAAQILSPEATITIEKEDLDLESSPALILGETWNFKNLTAFTLVSSSNGGANAIAREAQNQSGTNFVTQMNETAKNLGLQNTYFRNVTGLDMEQDHLSGANSTALDIARLFTHILNDRPDLLTNTNQSQITVSSLEDIKHTVTNTNEIVNQIPRLISSKTGTTQLAGENLTILFYPINDHPVAIVTLGGSYQSRFTDMKKLVQETTEILKKR